MEEEHHRIHAGFDQGNATCDRHRSGEQISHRKPHQQVESEKAYSLGDIPRDGSISCFRD